MLSSVCLSVTLCIAALRVGVRVENCTIVFLATHFLFTSSDTFAVGYIVQPQHTAEIRTAEISASGTAMDGDGHWTAWSPRSRHLVTIAMTQNFRPFGSAFIPHVVRSTIGLLGFLATAPVIGPSIRNGWWTGACW